MSIRSWTTPGKSWALLAVLASLVLPCRAFGVVDTLFGPQRFDTPSGNPKVINGTVDAPDIKGNLFVRVVNGDGAGGSMVASATITLNGNTLVGPGELSSSVPEVTKAVPGYIVGLNAYSIVFGAGSAPGSYITVYILGENAVGVMLVSPSPGAFVYRDRATASGWCYSYTPSYTLLINGVAATCVGDDFAAEVPVSSGNNTLTATLEAPGGVVSRDSVTISVDLSPVADAGTDRYVATRTTATVDGRQSYDPEGAPITYYWRFAENPGVRAPALNDPTFATPSFVPRSDGRYVLSLVVSDGHSSSAPDNVVVTAGPPNVPPVADAGPDQSVVTGNPVNLSGSATDADGDPVAFSWRFLSMPPGSLATLAYPSSPDPNFLADVDGQYVAELTVFDGKEYGLPDNVVVTAATPNAPPVANAGTDNTVSRNVVIVLDGTQSYDPDNDPIAFAWSVVSQPAGSTAAFDNAASPTPSILADAEGQYVFRLTVNDGQVDSAPSTVVVTSIDDPPVADAGPDQTVTRNTSLTLDGGGSHDANGDALAYLWSLASAPAGSTASLGNPTAVNPVITPDLAGAYVVSLTVSDGRLSSAPDNVLLAATALNVVVPNVVGMAQTNAQAAIVAATLAVGTVTTANSDTVAAGSVIGQNPAAGSTHPEGSPVDLVVSLGPVMVTVPDVTGMTLAGAEGAIVAASLVAGTVTQAASGTVPAGHVVSQSPSPGTVVVHGTGVDLVVSSGSPPVTVPDLFGKPLDSAQSLLTSAGLATGAITSANSETVIPGNVIGQSPSAGTSVAQGSAVALTISSGPAPLTLPPDPAIVAPPVDPTVATSVFAATRFLYTGDNSVQTGIAPGTIELKRAAVLRGKVMTADNAALSGVTVTILNHPEFGQTITRADGKFDLAVNGGGYLILNYAKGGYLTVHRQVDVPWGDYVHLPDVLLVQYNTQVTTLNLSAAAPVQVARGSVATDDSGARQSTLLFFQGTQAEAVLPDGSSRQLPSISVRATEYTVGAGGPKAMPAGLPPTSAYTYCAELSVDEAVSAGASEVRFNRPVINYVENFLGFPVGGIVPVGYYDRKKGAWIPADNGRVIKVLAVSGGLAAIDSDGDGAADNAAVLSALGMTDVERERLASLYAPGTGLWRVPLTHFSAPDYNWPFRPPDDARRAEEDPKKDPDRECGPTTGGSIIECTEQVLGESLPITGTPFTLNYRSSRAPGRLTAYTVEIPISGSTLPQSLKRIDLEIRVAGRYFPQSFPAAVGQSVTFAWDGLDAYGRTVQGAQQVTVRIGYVYDAIYTEPAQFTQSFARFGGTPITTVPSRQEIILWRDWVSTLGVWDAKAQGLGGWTLSPHHAYDVVGRVLYYGDGSHRSAEATGGILTNVAGGDAQEWCAPALDNVPANSGGLCNPNGVAVGPDGSFFISDWGNSRIRRVGTDGIITTVAGDGGWGYSGDNVPATQTSLRGPAGVAVGPDGSIYIADYSNFRVRKVGVDNIITTVAGDGRTRGYPEYAPFVDNVPATQASLCGPIDIAVGPDGSLYFIECARVRRVGPDGIITTVAGTGQSTPVLDNVPATQSALRAEGLALGADGRLYIADTWNNRVRRVGLDGIITTVGGTGSGANSPDGIPAVQASIGWPEDVAVGPDGSIYVASDGTLTVRRIGPDGILTTVAGSGLGYYNHIAAFGSLGVGGLATQAFFNDPWSLAFAPDGSLYVVDYTWDRVVKIAPLFLGVSGSQITHASEDGRAIYVFDGNGKHLSTLDTLTGVENYRFEYDAAGLVNRIVDGDNNATIVERDGDGTPRAVVAPGGQRSVLSLDPAGYVEAMADPAGNTTRLGHTAGGLLTGMTDPRDNSYSFVYDPQGRLRRDEDPEGGSKDLVRTEMPDGHAVALTTGLGRTTTYEVESLSTGSTRRVTTGPAGARTVLLLGRNGVVTSNLPDGTISETREGPDPRFGVSSPIPAKTTRTTPGGLTSITQVKRTATLADPADIFSLVSQTDDTAVNGRMYTQVYNAAQRLFTLTTPAGRHTATGIDNQGRTILVSVDPAVDNVALAYDTRGRLAQTSQGGKNWTFGYDDLNRLTSRTDPLQRQVQYAYDNADRVSRVILPSGRTYAFGHDNNGNVTQITMPSGAVHALGYTKTNLDNSYTPPGNPAYGTQYNLDREWVRTTLPSGRAIDGGYDNGGRLRDVTYPEAAVSMIYFDNTDRVGTLTRASIFDNQSIAFSYDGFLTTRMAYSGVANGEYRYSYDNNFRIMSVALDNVWTTLSRDNDGLLTRYGRFTITRNGPAGAPSALTDNTLNISYTYDSSGRPWVRTHTVNGQQVHQLTLGYDNVGRISTKTEVVAGASHVFDYTYDVDGQLFQVRHDNVLVEQYGYDNNANRTSTLAASATYDDQDRLIQQGGVSYTFDDDGYLTTRGSDTFTYSARGELLSATVGGQTTNYHYDGMGRRIGKTDVAGTSQYLYGNPDNPFQVTASRDAAGNLTTYFYDVNGNLYAFDRGGQRYYVATDQLGTPKAVTDGTGAVVKAVEYDAWGVKLSDTNPTFDLPVGFAGGLADGATALVRFGFRDYEPGTGRWTARDPILFNGGQANLFGYAFNDPLNYIDPSGESVVGKVVVFTYKGARKVVGKLRNLKDLARKMKESEEVICKTRREARDVAEMAGGGKRPIHEIDAKTGKGHYHTHDRSGGHALYGVAAALTASYWVEGHGSVAETAGFIVDLVNPFSLPSDVLEIVDTISGN